MDVLLNGNRFALGEAETGATVGIIDYSRRVTDDFGVTTVTQRGFARRLGVRLAVPLERIDAVQRHLADLRATSAQWIADDRFTWLSPTGFYKDFEIDLAIAPVGYCRLTVEGLTETEVVPDLLGDPAPEGMVSTLQLLQPVSVTDSVLSASSVPEADAPAWSTQTGYLVGARVLRQHVIYEALVAHSGVDPLKADGKWLAIGPSNRWAMFDQALGTLTSAAAQISVTLVADGVDAVALLDVTATTVRVETAGYDRTQQVTGGPVTFLDLGGKGQVTVTVAGQGTVSVGTLLVGRLVKLGTTEAAPTAGINDFSRKTIDDFGEVSITRRAYAKRMSAKALIRTDALDLVANGIAAVRAVPSLWIGQDGYDSLTIYGFFRDFEIEVGEQVSKLSLSVEGFSAADKPAALVDWDDLGDRNGNKPEDKATNTRNPSSLIGDRTVTDVLGSIDVNVDAILAQALRQDDLLQVFDLRTMVEGQPVATKFLAFRTEARDPVNGFASASDFTGVFAKAKDGTGYTMNLQAVKAGNATFADVLSGYNTSLGNLGAGMSDLQTITGTLSQNLSQVSALAGNTSAKVTQLMQAFASDSDGIAGFVMAASVDANGLQYITGISGIAGTRGNELNFLSENFNFVSTAGGNRLRLLSYNAALKRWEFSAEVYARRVVADSIQAGDIKSAAVTKTRYAIMSADVSVSRGATANVVQIAFVKDDNDSDLKVQFFGMFWSPDDLQFAGSFVVDNNTAYPAGSVNIILDSKDSQGRMPITPFSYLSGIPAGNHTITFQVTNTETDPLDLTIKAGSAIEVIELKKAAV
ncbi:hypothetical protein KV697_10895 [Sphingomonas sanguinis]|uniref:hypothetical protein n=1 Tax=Sphingomonas sanguinis TaxID=33051 RepID=UPI001C58B80A|nr:hypothetical protein [Sphingomonas sanguinis]QXT34341.1 hypothetical protein KV697_10895 [Sphingomonas sanguinis]